MLALVDSSSAPSSSSPLARSLLRGGRKTVATTAADSRYACPMKPFTAVKVFSSTMARDREVLGERITEWLRAHPELQLVDTVVTQTSDDEYHCLSITLFLAGTSEADPAAAPSLVRPVVPRPSR